VKDKINELAINSKKNIRDLLIGTNEFTRGYQPRSNLMKDKNDDLHRVPQHLKQVEELLFQVTEGA
jgi:hypothetical protein